jgi:hypothetical protein
MPSGITQKDPLVLGQEVARGSLRVQDILTLSPPQRHRKHAGPPAAVLALSVAGPAPRPQPACRSTPDA